MKDEFKEYLKSETEVNKRAVYMNKLFLPIAISLIIIGLGLVAFAMYMALA